MAEEVGEEADGKLVRPGLLETADGGTLYLDEVADMPLSTQARILRVLTEQSFVRVGGTRQIGVDVRVVSSTSRDLANEMEEKRFREDLFYRLNVVPVEVPSLAERRDDIPSLADGFFARYATEQGLRPPTISEEAMAALQAYDWPGNVRELRAAAERFALGLTLDPGSAVAGQANQPSLAERVATYEARLIAQMLAETGGNTQEASRLLGVPLRTLNEKIQRHGLRPSRS